MKTIRALSIILVALPGCLQAMSAPASRAAASVLAQCPALLRPTTALPAGTSLFGHVATAGEPHERAMLANTDAAGFRSAGGVAEIEEDVVNSAGSTTAFRPEAGIPLSIACRYGRYKPPLGADALMLIPIASTASGTCRFRQAVGRQPASMICTRRP